ncbi:MAG TPA: NAD(P)/FAD-dependent oxidoreductase [Steroidobacteraceae bacterium]|nr:NAD(P)/FAD-dependent oxidoreductase [Steroidobacteraceae bacterium]
MSGRRPSWYFNNVPRVVVVGGGFAGLWAVRALARAPVDITLIDRCNHHLFQPLLYQVATAGLAAPSIAAPLRQILRRQRNVTVQLGTVTEIDKASGTLTVDGARCAYDYLILATGVSHAYFGHEDWADHAPGLKTLADALHMRARFLTAFERAESSGSAADARTWLTFVVVVGGPTGVELAGTLAEIARHTLPREFRRIDPRAAQVLLVEAGPRVLPAFPADLSQSAHRQLERLGVTVRTNSAVTSISADSVRIGADTVPTRTVVWAAGVTGSTLGRALGVSVDHAGRVLVESDLSVPGHPGIFVAGDLAAVSGPHGPVPGIAPAAKQMGVHAARTIGARLSGRASTPFRYRDQGLLATIGRHAAVVDLGRVRLSGLLAWWFWLLAHVYFLIGFRNRLVVLIDWADAYWTYDRGARIIIEASRPP